MHAFPARHPAQALVWARNFLYATSPGAVSKVSALMLAPCGMGCGTGRSWRGDRCRVVVITLGARVITPQGRTPPL